MDETRKPQILEVQVPKVPLPSEVPSNVDFSQFPQEVLRSSAVETLIQQNEDLMSRLKLNLRRVSRLEDQLSESENYKKKFQFHFENLREKTLILKDKCQSLETRKEDHRGKMIELADRNKAIEVEYARLYTESKEQRQQMIESIEQLSCRIKALSKYRTKMSKLAQSLKTKHLDVEIDLVAEQKRYREQELTFKELQSKMSEATEYIQAQGLQHKVDLRKLTESYEERVQALETKIEVVDHENNKLRPFLNENIKLQNQIIDLNRQLSNTRENSETENEKQKTEISELKLKMQSLKDNLEDLNGIKQQLSQQEQQNQGLNSQLENTQSLWHESQKDTENLVEKNTALQKLNQNLSLKLNRYRQEIQDLKNQVQSNTQDHTQRVVASQLALQNSKKATAARAANKTTNSIPDKLESLIAEIEIGQ